MTRILVPVLLLVLVLVTSCPFTFFFVKYGRQAWREELGGVGVFFHLTLAFDKISMQPLLVA